MIKNTKVNLLTQPLELLESYEKEYEKIEIIASSPRIDTIAAKIIGTSRNKIIEIIKNKEIILNYNILKNVSYQLKENDVFSIRRHGKYKFIRLIKNTKNKNFIFECYKYK